MENTKKQIDTDVEERFSVFEIADVQVGLSVFYIKEVINLTHITQLPNAPPYIPGIFNFRGKIISVIDLALFFNLERDENQKHEGMIVTQTKSALFSIFYDRIHEFIQIRKTQLGSSSIKISDSIKPFLYGVYKNKVLLLNGENLFKSFNFFKI
jgi:purine-binding chemotaxis protein CheW